MIKLLLVVVMGLGLSSIANAQDDSVPPTPSSACTLEVVVEGAIGPATVDLLERTEKRAEKLNCKSVLVLINTPGGNLQSTRMIVEQILNSSLPYLCLVYPSGAHAGSAGAIILQACHVAGGVTATNIGAATPVSGGGEQIPEDMRNKLINDTRSWTEGLAELRGRDKKFAREIVELAKAVSIEEAKKINAVDWAGDKRQDFLDFASGRKVKMDEGKEAEVVVGETQLMPLDFRYKLMATLTDPQVAYLMFMGSLGLLYFELTHPGMIVPGVIGAVGLLISLMALHMLDVAVVGLLLIFLGVALMIAEAFVASFGVLGIGGVVSFFLGSVFLFDPEVTGVVLPMSTILPATILLGLLMIGIAYLALSSRKARRQATFDVLQGKVGTVSELQIDDRRRGMVDVNGEIWKFVSNEELNLKDEVVVLSHEGLTLKVKRK